MQFSLATLAVLLWLPAVGPTPSPPVPARLPPEADAEYRRANALLSRQQFADAIGAFQKANRLSGGKCFPCLEAMAVTQSRLNRYDEAISSARDAIKIATSDEERARGENQLGLAYAGKAKKGEKDSKDLVAAEEAFRRALRIDEKLNAPRFHLAKVLIREGREKDADAILDDYLKREPPGALADQARALKENHRRATELFAPDFKLTTLDGKTITLASLKGKVVLIDFWATWCAPCLQALPELKEIRKRFEKDPFEMISISVDKDRKTMEGFVAKNGMAWPQSFDEGYHVSRDAFGVNTFPSYFILDPDGVVAYYARGYAPSTGGRLVSEIKQALKKKTAGKSGA